MRSGGGRTLLGERRSQSEAALLCDLGRFSSMLSLVTDLVVNNVTT